MLTASRSCTDPLDVHVFCVPSVIHPGPELPKGKTNPQLSPGGAWESQPKLQVTVVVVGSTFCSVAVNGLELPEPATAVSVPGDMEMVAVAKAIVMVVLA